LNLRSVFNSIVGKRKCIWNNLNNQEKKGEKGRNKFFYLLEPCLKMAEVFLLQSFCISGGVPSSFH